MTSVAQWDGEPFLTESLETLAPLRPMLERLGYTERGVCAAAGVDRIYDVPPLRKRTDKLVDVSDPRTLLVQLFMDGVPHPWSTVRSVLPGEAVDALTQAGLLRGSRLDPGACAASVALYPDERLYIVSDKHSNLDSVADGVPADIVYSALTSETHRFVDLMPRVRCQDYLELCSGSGIAALVAAETFAEHAWAVDITERSTRFARFNAALNGLTNVTALAGDLYAPVAGRTFDVITAHPPYVPSQETAMVFRDGGDDGEQITRRIIAGLPEFLRPGGQFYCDCMMTDRKGAPLEQRIREMLGPAEGEFDVLLGQGGVFDGESYLARVSHSSPTGRTPEDMAWHRELVDRLSIERFVVATFVIRRRAEARPVFTRRRVVSAATNSKHFQWYLRWAAATEAWNDSPPLLDARPCRVDATELKSRSVCTSGGWTVLDSTLVARTPFAHDLRCPVWLASLVARCDGEVTVRDHLRHFRDIGVVPSSATDAEFALLVGQLADGGFVELEDFPLPSLDDRGPVLA